MSEFSITPGVCTQESSSCLQLHGLCVATAATLESRFCPKLEQEQIQPDQGFGGVAALGGGIVASSVGG